MQLSRLNQINLSIHLHLSVFAKLKRRKRRKNWTGLQGIALFITKKYLIGYQQSITLSDFTAN